MKKTLVALAALAATGAFAQVSITGEYAFGYQATSTAAGDASGFGTDTSQLFFNATEDLGGGNKLSLGMSLAGADRSGESGDGSVRGRNATMTLMTKVGAFTMGTLKPSDYLSGGLAGQGVYWQGFDGKVFGARANRDAIQYTLPYGNFKFSAVHAEAPNVLGLGEGTVGNTPGIQRLNQFIASYASGALALDAQYLLTDGGVDSSNAMSKDAYRLAGTYDLGVVSFGAGVQQTNYMGSAKTNDSLVSIKAPMGALTLGAQWAQREVKDSNVQANGTRSGYSLNAWYNLSKRTYVVASYANWEPAVNVKASNQSTLLMVHDF